MHWWAQQHKKAWTSTENNSCGWSENHLHGKEKPFTTSSQEKNTLQEVGLSLSKSTIKRRLHESKYRGFTTRCKQGQIRLYQKTSKKKKPDHFWSTCTRMTGRKKYAEGLEQLMIQSIQHHLWSAVEQCDGMSMHGFQWRWVTGVYWWRDRGQKQRKNSEVYSDILSAQIQSNAAKLIGRSFIVQVDNAWRAPLTAWCGFTATASKCKWHT